MSEIVMSDIDSFAERVVAAEEAKDIAWQEYLTAYDAEQNTAPVCGHDECDCPQTDLSADARTDEERFAFNQASAVLASMGSVYRAVTGGV